MAARFGASRGEEDIVRAPASMKQLVVIACLRIVLDLARPSKFGFTPNRVFEKEFLHLLPRPAIQQAKMLRRDDDR